MVNDKEGATDTKQAGGGGESGPLTWLGAR
jgi:hypothetical protein